MIKRIYISRSIVLIVYLTIFSTACKSKKTVTSSDNLQGLNTKFERLYIEACTQYVIGNYSVSNSQFLKCSEIKPEEASVYYQLSKINLKLNNEHLAFQNASKSNLLAPENKFYAQNYASFLSKNGEYKKAIEVLEISLKSNLTDENIYKKIDALLESQNETDKRIILWNNYKKNTGLKVSTGLKLIELYRTKKDYAAAHTLYDELKTAAPSKTKFYVDDAKLYEEQKDFENANLNYKRAIEINPNNWEVNYALYQYYLNKNDELNASYYFSYAFEKSVTSFEVKTPACQKLLKQLILDSHQCKYALIAANGLTELNGNDVNALFTAATFYEHCGNYLKALDNYKFAVAINPNLFDAWVGAMNCGIILYQYDQSISIGEKAIDFFPNTVLLYENLARLYNLNNQFDKAILIAVDGERIAFDDSTKSKLILQKGIALYHQKKYTEAKNVLESAIAINKTDPELYDWLGNIYFFVKDEQKAIENWKLAKELGSKNVFLDKKIADKKIYE